MKIERFPWMPDDDPSIEGSIIVGRVKITIDTGATMTTYNGFELDAPNGKALAVWWDKQRNCFVTHEITD